MDLSLISLEVGVVLLGLLILLIDLWTPEERKADLGWLATGGLAVVFCYSFSTFDQGNAVINGYSKDALAVYFQGFFVMAAILVVLLTMSYAPRIRSGISELYALTCFALAGMTFAAGASSLVMLFVAVELITITFYVLTSFERHRLRSLESGIKYLILGAASSAIMVFGIALIYGSTGALDYHEINRAALASTEQPMQLLFQLGVIMVLGGLAFKLAAVPFQLWVPDVYQGAPTPVTAFLSSGSKAAGIVLMLRLLAEVCPSLMDEAWLRQLLGLMAGATILYGSLCALRQRNLKRLLGYSSIASAGYVLLGLVVLNNTGAQAVLFYLAGYIFAVLAAFTVVSVVSEESGDEDISILANLHQRSPLMAVALTLAIVSLAGIPPLAGFLGKFTLLRAVFEAMETIQGLPWIIGAAMIGVVISLYYYFGVIREIYWGTGRFWEEKKPSAEPLDCPRTAEIVLLICLFGLIGLGLFPEPILSLAGEATSNLFSVAR